MGADKIQIIEGRALPLRGDDMDTDRIMPARFLRAITFEGLEQHVFEDDRKAAAHPFDDRRYQGASILIVNANFGCGSSREHAVWALAQYGFRAIIAPSFADIFTSNCYRNGLLPVRLASTDVDALIRSCEGGLYEIVVDLEQQVITDDRGFSARFTAEPYGRELLLRGLDEIGRTLLEVASIEAYERGGSGSHA
jgi:3-isopropylmalate/(R)-2-methylmalate dehydratase small subunit